MFKCHIENKRARDREYFISERESASYIARKGLVKLGWA